MGKSATNTPIWRKPFLTIEEATDYFGIGEKKIKKLTGGDNNRFVLWNGTKRLIKRAVLEEYLLGEFSV